MTKKMRELMEKMNSKYKEAESIEDATEKAARLDEFDALKAAYEVEARAEDAEKALVASSPEVVHKEHDGSGSGEEGDSYAKSVKAFADAARRGFKSMNEGTPTDGGYTVPEDISTKIIELREAKRSLLDLVSVETVKTKSGSRTFKKRSQKAGFSKVGEGGKIPATGTPKFERVEYAIDKYAGYLPITNELLEDSDANLVSTITEWFADESRVTSNKLILATLDEKYTGAGAATLVEIKSVDEIKKTLNVTLGQAFKQTSKIITNDDGLQWLDTLKDADGKYLLSPNPADQMQMRLSAGATTVPIDVVPNGDLPTDATRGIPFYVGDLKEAIKFFDRKKLSIMSSPIAAIGELNAFEEDLTIYRAIEREDVRLFDKEAFVKGFVAVSAG